MELSLAKNHFSLNVYLFADFCMDFALSHKKYRRWNFSYFSFVWVQYLAVRLKAKWPHVEAFSRVRTELGRSYVLLKPETFKRYIFYTVHCSIITNVLLCNSAP